MSIFDKSKISLTYQTNILFSSQGLASIFFALPLLLLLPSRFSRV